MTSNLRLFDIYCVLMFKPQLFIHDLDFYCFFCLNLDTYLQDHNGCFCQEMFVLQEPS